MDKKTVLIIGFGGREHAIGWKLKQSHFLKKLYFAPGNGGTEKLGENVNIKASEINKLLKFSQENKIDLTIVGPENPLALGIVDLFEKNQLAIFGPTKKATRLETDKAWSIKFMKRHRIPCPKSYIFSDNKKALKFINHSSWEKMVVKASGLALGKGVVVTDSKKEASEAVQKIMIEKKFGSAGNKIIIQERLYGEEVSLLTLTDGKTILPLIPAQDHKRIFDNDQGPNTGGMGAYAPVPFVTKKILNTITNTILKPTIKGMEKEGYSYKGVLYAGLMMTKHGIKVLEYNARFGDPETQPQLVLLKSDLLPLLLACTNKTLNKQEIIFYPDSAVCVVLAAKGYPDSYQKGETIHGLKIINNNVVVFHAGTVKQDGKILSNGGRVLGVTAFGKNINKAVKKAYQAIGKKGVYFKNMQYRQDIGKKALKKII